MIYPGTTIQVQSLGDGKYMLTSPCGTAKVDTQKDLFMSSDYEAFTNMMGMVQPGMPNVIYDALPTIRWKALDAKPKQVDVTLDYGKYGIDIREDAGDVYFPFATISDLYVDGYMHMADFNGQTVMVAPNGSYSLVAGYPSFSSHLCSKIRAQPIWWTIAINLCSRSPTSSAILGARC